MNNTKTTKRALFTSVVAIFMCVTMLIGTTFAWFTDTASTGVNKIQAGNLDVEVEYSKDGNGWADLEGTDSLFSGNLWEPGHTEVVYLKITNAGTLALNYKVLVNPVSENGGVNIYGESFKLSDYLVFGTTGPETTLTTYTRDTARGAVGTTTGLNVNSLTKTGTMAGKTDDATDVQYLALVVYMPETVGNEANYKTGTAAPTIELGIKVIATQKTAESDSFGDNYDEGAVTDPFYTVGSYYNYFPQVSASAPVVAGGNTVITATGKLNQSDATVTTLAKVTVPAAALADGVTKVDVSVKPTDATNSDAQNTIATEIAAGREVSNFDVKVSGIKDGNTDDISVKIFVGKGLSNVKVYHNGALIEGASYNAATGIVSFTTTSFSDYTVSYDPAVAAIGDKTYGTLALAVAAANNGDTVTLLKDVSLSPSLTVDSDKNMTLDFNGYTLTLTGGAALMNNGTLTLKDATGRGGVYSTNQCAIFAGNNSVTTIESGTYKGLEGAVTTHTSIGSTVTINGGTFIAIDNAVISSNGTDRNGEANTIIINGGTFNGGIKTSGYVACGIYSPWKDNITVNGGIFNITGGAGIVARAGNVTVNGGKFNVTGNTTGKVGDSRVVVPCSVFVFDSEANYPAMTADSKITVTGGTFTSEVDNIAVVGTGLGRVAVTGGKFSTDPTNFCADGYKAALEGEYYVVSLCTDHVYEGGVCTECGKVQETWLAIENAMTEAPEGYSLEGNTIAISTNYGLAWFAKQVNAGNNFSNYTVTLTDDIDLLDYAWAPINGFTGTFDGGEHTISNIYVNGSPTGKGYGLFGASNAKAYKNVKIHNVHVVGNAALGALVGEMFTGTVDNVHVSGNIMIGINTQNGHIANYNSSYAGGIVGHGYATITNSSVKGNDGSVIGHGRQIGGIYGFSGEGNFTPVKNCTVENVTLIGTKSVGGILGWAHYGNNVENCSVKNVSVKLTAYDISIGFITGTTNAEDCYAGQMMEFYGNTVENSSLYVNDALVSQEATMKNMYAPYGYGPCYATDGNGNYVFFANRTEADTYVTTHPDMTVVEPAAKIDSYEYFETVQDALNYAAERTGTYQYVYLMKDCEEPLTIPASAKIYIYDKGHQLAGQITNNGTFAFGTSSGTHSATILNNGTLTLSKNQNSGLTVINNGTVMIAAGATYDLSKITNQENGTLVITGGSFSAEPQSDWIAEWYTVVSNENGTYSVRLMNDEEAIAAGAVVRYSTSTSSSRKYFKTLEAGLQNGAVHLLTNVDGSFAKNGSIDIYCDEYVFTGSLSCPGKYLYIDSGTAVLDRIECGTFYGGYSTYTANVTVKDGTATAIKVAKNATVVIEGGTYTGSITVTTGGTGSLTIKGGTFSVDPSAYVNTETHTVTGNGNGTWTVSAK